MPDKILSQDQLNQLDSNIRKMIDDGLGREDIDLYAKQFKDKFGRASGPIAPSAPTIRQELPTFQQQQETLQQVQSKYDKAVQDDRSRAGKLLSTIYNGLVGAGESLAGGVVQLSTMFPSAPYLQTLPTAVKRSVEIKGKEAVRKAADVVRSEYTTREEEKHTQGKFDVSDIVTNGIGLDDLEGLAASSGRILGDIALAAPTMGASYFIQGINDATEDYDEAVKKAGIQENANARMLYGLAGGTINGLLEKFAIDKIVGEGPVFKSIQKKAIANVLKNTSTMSGKVAIDAIEKLAKEEVKELTKNLKSRGLRAGYRALVEGGTEAAQAAAEDGAKFATNWAQGVDAFNEQEIKDQFFKNLVNSAAAGAVFGPVIGFGMDKTFGRNINTQVLEDIANANTPEDFDRVNQELEDTFNKNNFSDAERQMVMDNARRYAEVKRTLPADTPAASQIIAIPKIESRIKLDNEIKNKQTELESIDESLKPSFEQDIALLQDKRASLNDEIREIVTGEKFNYTEENGKFYKGLPDGSKEEISRNRYDLEQIKQEDNATTEGQRPIQEGGTAGDISQRPGAQEGRAQEAPTKTDTRYRNISSETAVGIPTLLGSKVVYKLPNRKITGTLIQEGQTLSVEDENGDVVAELGNVDELSNMSPEEMNLTVLESRVEPTEKGFSVDGKELLNENENPFDAISVDKNGNVMNVVLTTAGGKRRKFRGRVAQDLATQISAKEDQRLASEDQKLQREFALPTPTAPKVITTQPTIAKITEDNLDEIDAIPGSTLQKKVLGNVKPVVKAIGAAVKNITGSPVSVNIHDQKSFSDAVIEAGGTQDDSVSRGFYMGSDGSIHLNMDALASDTMLHEGFHPILDVLEKYNPEIINELFTELESIPEAADIIAQAKETYTGDVTQKKEAITDFVAGVADGRIVLNPSNFEKIKNFILNMLNKIGIGQGGSTLMNVQNEQDLVKLAQFITEKFTTGEQISLEALDLVTGPRQYESGEGLDIQKDLPQETTGNGPQFSKGTLEEAKRNVKNVDSLKGTNISRVVFYDITRVGKLDIKNIKTQYTPDVDGKGGPFYSYMDSSIKNKAVLAFVSINQAIQSLQRQILYPNGVHAIAAQNPLTAHLGNKSTLSALFGQGIGIFQNAAKTKAQENEIVKTLVSEIDRISKMEKGEAKDAVVKILKTVDLKSIKTIDQFRDNILLGEGDSFGSRGSILAEILQNKQTKITASTRDSHKILHYKYGVPTIADIAQGNNQQELSNAELGDVMKLVKPSTEPVIYTTSKEQFDKYSKNPTPEMRKAGIRIEFLEEGGHESYPFVLAGENVALLENYVSAAQLFERFKSLKKSQTFFRVGRMKKYAEAGMIPQDVVPEATGPKFQRLAPNGKPSNLNELQYNQVRTPEFKNWFGDWENDPANASKVVDENGEPLVVYHGSGHVFDTFEQGITGSFFAKSLKSAETYGVDGSIYPVFLSIKNPALINAKGEQWREVKVTLNSTTPSGYKKSILNTNEIVESLRGARFPAVIPDNDVSSPDGVVFKNIRDSVVGALPATDVYVSFKPNQIKSAIGNKGTFSTEDNRIQFQKSPTKTEKSTVKRFAKDQFLIGGILGKDVLKLKEQMSGELSDEMTKAQKSSTKAMNLIKKYSSVVTQKDIEDFLTSKPNAEGRIPLDLAGTLAEMRAHIDNLTDRLINLGVIDDPEEVAKYQANKGKYMLRSYEIFNAQPTAMESLLLGKSKTRIDIDNVTKKLKNVDQAKVDRALEFLAKEIGKGDPTLTPEQRREQAIIEANKILADTESKFAPKKYIGSTNVRSLEERLDIAPEIRALMGEYTDPVYNYYASIFKLAALTSNRKFLNDLKEEGMGKFLFANATKDASVQIAAEKSEALKPLAGLYTFPEIKEALEQQEKMQRMLVVKFLGWTRKLKTVYNPATHVKNIIGNAGFFVSNGHWNYMDTAWKLAKNNPKEFQELMSVLRRQGVLNSSVGMGELRSYFDKHESIDDFLQSTFEKAEEKSTKGKNKDQITKIKRSAGKVTKAIENAYQMEDDIFKILAFVNESNRYAKAIFGKDYSKLTPEQKSQIDNESAEIVKNTYPTFSRAPKFVKSLSKGLLLGNFLTFPVESVRVSYNTLKLAKDEINSGNPELKKVGISRILGTLAYNGIFSTLSYYFSMAGVGVGGMIGAMFDDEDEKEKREKMNLLRAPWTNNSEIIPIKFSDGKFIYMDIGSLDSYNYQKKIWSAFWDNIGDEEGFKKAAFAATKQLVDPYLTLDFTYQTFKDLYDNNDESTGRKIYNPEVNGYQDKVLDVSAYLTRKLGPGVVGSAMKIYRYYNEGDAEKINSEIQSQIVRTYNTDVEKQFARYLYASRAEGTDMTDVGFKERLDDAESIYTDVKYKKGVSQQEIDSAYSESVSAYKNVLGDISKYYQAALSSGVPQQNLERILFRAKLGQRRGVGEIYSIMKGVADLPDEAYIRK